MANNSLEKVNINHSEQWLLVQGKSAKTPLIIHVQAGPGLPIIPEADAMEKLLHLEENYLVAYWDQRGCGKSYNKTIDPKTINLSQLTDDVIAVTKYLLKKYQKDKAILVGYSIGATLSLMAAAKDSSIFSRIFLVGIDIDMPMANKYTLEFAMNKAKEKNNRKFIKQIIELEKTPIVDTKTFQQRAKILTDLGGIKTGSSYNQLIISTIKNMLFSKAYSLKDILRTIKGMEFCQNALLPELDTLNLFHTITSVHVPVHFIQGKKDGVAPYQMAVKFYEYLQADKKAFTGFENSAHLPQYEEPEKFAKLLKEEIVKEHTRDA
ncbi:MAG: alpha/beta hydrolase [Nitrospirae bacterium]|nr:alpha/beta hydrolase [Nitrospirota bacterium]